MADPLTTRLQELDAMVARFRAEPDKAAALNQALAALAVAMEMLGRAEAKLSAGDNPRLSPGTVTP